MAEKRQYKEVKKIRTYSWAEAIASAFTFVEPAPTRYKVVDMEVLSVLPKSVGESMSITSSIVLSNYKSSYTKVIEEAKDEPLADKVINDRKK